MLQDSSQNNEANPSALIELSSLSASLSPMDKPTFPVPTLTLKLNRPVRMRRNVDAWNRLQRILDIQVQPAKTPSNQEPQYDISVFLRHNQSRIPTVNIRAAHALPLAGSPSSSSAAPASNMKPDLYVVRTFAELETLRSQVWDSARQSHPVYCELCDGMCLLMLTKLSLPSLLTMTIHRSQAARAKKMRKFLLRVLSELHKNKSQCVPACRGQHDLPLLLHSFLFGDEDAQEVDDTTSTSPRDV